MVHREEGKQMEMPIGLSEASSYEEFTVIKVNSMGFEQERILGIDQTKIYNYDKSYRREKREPSFFDKLWGLNEETGTKKPFRLVSDVVSIEKLEKGLLVVYREKSIVYLVREGEVRDRIYRKLKFLVEHQGREELMGSSKKRN